jgi:hypothetical protein
MHNQTKVLLPAWIFEQAQDEKELKRFVLKYMNKSYPGYRILKVKGKFAICDISR